MLFYFGPDKDHLHIRFGKFFEASARGWFAIAAVVLLILALAFLGHAVPFGA
jgi:hypothetical protein